jgi:hypothetical protein
VNTFFNRYCGPECTKLVEVRAFPQAKPIIALDTNVESASASSTSLTPEQAKALGRALIKAAKFAEKGKS